jgi:hypothetical protein
VRDASQVAPMRCEQLADVAVLAREHIETAMQALVEVATTGESETVPAPAATALLDLGYGRPPQAVTGEDGEPVQVIAEVRWKSADFPQCATAIRIGRLWRDAGWLAGPRVAGRTHISLPGPRPRLHGLSTRRFIGRANSPRPRGVRVSLEQCSAAEQVSASSPR